MRQRKVPLVSDIHYLLGSTLRDPENDRVGRVVGLNQHYERPIIDVLWEDAHRVERVEITFDQLESLMTLARSKNRAERDETRGQQTAAGSDATSSSSEAAQPTDVRRRA